MATAFNETCVVEVLREAAREVVSPRTVTALLSAAQLLESDAEILLHAAHRIDVVLHQASSGGSPIQFVVMD
ncbi:hypothetical protein JVX91_19775 [Pseudomonas sp. PDNC002]|uniref:hypothetical protein n=1 Tax=Pseudomonas sp. PDNC002 TaxID=2811422 RepID=UPI00196272DB|nr:hypothetical protein [Pseudomonas sp. PDNC002]QRY77826.1 hypothetical protein JVX91_19775 [Pseudomonas sp. PDNC002]